MQLAWGPWVADLTGMIDGLGCIGHLPMPGTYMEQPARDMAIYETIRGRWVELMNKKRGAG